MEDDLFESVSKREKINKETAVYFGRALTTFEMWRGYQFL